MSTCLTDLSVQSDIDRCSKLWLLLRHMETERDVFRPERLAMRLNVLDELDALIGDSDFDARACIEPELLTHAKGLGSRLEQANEMLYKAARIEIAATGRSTLMECCLMALANAGNIKEPRAGLSFDLLDEFMSGVLQLREPDDAIPRRSLEMADYQPTPARHILDLIRTCNFSKDDVLVDLGSGLGHVPLLVSILTGINTLGIEIQLDHIESAREVVQRLALSGVRFAAEDVRTADLSFGSVFYMFSPFTGSLLRDVLYRLRKESDERPIKICSLGPCTRILQKERWLRAIGHPDTERVTLFECL